MNINDYRYITTIARLGSFTAAAKELYIAQPSLSQRVKHIEKDYGIVLFSRDNKGVVLTPEGECFVRHANQILNCENDLRRELEDMHNPSNKLLRIGTTQIIRSYLFDLLIQKFHESRPGIQFEFAEGDSTELQRRLLAGELDLAICYLPVISDQLGYQTLFRDSFVLVPAKDGPLAQRIVSRPEGENEPVSPKLFGDEPFAMASQGTRLHDYVENLQRDHGVAFNVKHYVRNYSMLYYLAKAGMASTILYESFFDPSKEYVPYYYLDAEDETPLEICVLWRKSGYLFPAARDLIRIAKEMNGSPLETL